MLGRVSLYTHIFRHTYTDDTRSYIFRRERCIKRDRYRKRERGTESSAEVKKNTEKRRKRERERGGVVYSQTEEKFATR